MPTRTIYFRNRLNFLPIIVAVLFLALSVKSYSDVHIDEFSIIIYGEISESDYRIIAENQVNLRHKQLMLLSKGGDVAAALKIGRLVRENEGKTFAGIDIIYQYLSPEIRGKLPQEIQEIARLQNQMASALTREGALNRVKEVLEERNQLAGELKEQQVCYSSCSLIWISGVTRRIEYGTIGIHRPYLASISADANEARARYESLSASIDSYVSEMGVDRRFYELTMNTPPQQMRIYDRDTIYDLVPEDDPAHQEVLANAYATLHGISPAEYRQRSIEAESCADFEMTQNLVDFNFLECRDAAFWGVSMGRYSRSKENFDNCKIPPEKHEELRSLRMSDQLASDELKQLYLCRSAALSN